MPEQSNTGSTSTPPPKRIAFAFPFRGADKKAITDEHDWHALLAHESAGRYLVSGDGMWHGGIHITDSGAGQSLDLEHGVRCLADGEVIAFRLNRTYPVSEVPASEHAPAISSPYSTGFALVRHMMEFPKDKRLVFYSLYMHLRAFAEYPVDASRWPAYWPVCFEVTTHANDRPANGPSGQVAPPGQKGLRVRANASANSAPIAILPQGSQVRIGERKHKWGQIVEAKDVELYPPKAGQWVEAAAVIGKWIYLGKDNSGHVLAREVLPDSAFDQIVVLPKPYPLKAGSLIGHLGRYDSLAQQTSERMVHIEVFCDDGIQPFIEDGRAWVNENCPHAEAWKQCGLPSEPTILRVERVTALYQEPNIEGGDPPLTDVVQTYALAELARRPERKLTETTPGADGQPRNWWYIDSADSRYANISGWVREQSFAGGRVTREFAQGWIDFEIIEGEHDATHTVFDSTQTFLTCRTEEVSNPHALDKLSPLMAAVFRAAAPATDGAQAVAWLCTAHQNPWVSRAMSRLIVKHESEWANPGKWRQLTQAIEEKTKPQAHHEAELQRIEKLAWWDEVKAKVPDFPEPSVFHIHPAALVGNFYQKLQLITIEMLAVVDEAGASAYHEQILPALNKFAKGYEVNSPRRIAHFLSQVFVESGFRNIEENLRYSAKRMKEIFGCRLVPQGSNALKFTISGSEVICTFGQLRPKLWTNTSDYENNPQNLGSYVYANRYDNGPESSGDGYIYRGRGLIQTTFKSNYQVLTNEHNKRFPQDQRNFVQNPDLVLSDIQYGIESAFVFWAVTGNINPIADSGDVLAVTKKVNGGTHGLTERRNAYNRLAPLLGLPLDLA